MMIHDITVLAGKYKARKRVGRGEGSGHGKQSGRGNKGQGARSGYARKLSFEGGQMPFFRRLAKFGFTNAPFRTKFWIVNLADIVAHPAFAKGGEVSVKTLREAGLIRDDSRDLKILGEVGEDGLKVKLHVTASRLSTKAKALIQQAGGSVTETGTRRDKVRGVDLNDKSAPPKNLTKKLKRGSSAKKGPKAAAEESAEAEAPAKGKKKA
ncbi:MAG: 50S ribosomal protein L15 [Phycisphaeraceae bacterium]|nr:MAG: 50S ribosomal protein L15 [Phycisphaeraceae bacterium]